MVPPLADTGEVGSTFEDIVEILHISCPYDSDIWFRYVGCDSLHGAEPGGVPPPVEIRLTDPPPTAPDIWDLESHSIRGVHTGSGVLVDGGLNWEATENGDAVHYHQDYHITLTGGRETYGGNDSEAVVGSALTKVKGSQGDRETEGT